MAKGDESPKAVFESLFKVFDVKLLTFENDTEPYAKIRDKQIAQLCSSHKIKLLRKSTHTLFDLDDLYELNGREVPNAYQSFLKILDSNNLKPEKPIDTFEGFKNGQFSLPDLLKDEKRDDITVGDASLQFYQGVPSLD